MPTTELDRRLMEGCGALARFEREAKVLAALNHPNVTPIWAAKLTRGRTLGSNQGVGEAMNRKE
jgi:hypothetical protein